MIGLGATGCSLLPLVSTLPIGTLSLIDGDTVEAANLCRQALYGQNDLGALKVEKAAQRTEHLHGARRIIQHPVFIDAVNIEDLLGNVTMVADCTDDIHARELISHYCERMRIPLFTGAIHGAQLQVIGLHTSSGPGLVALRSFFPAKAGMAQDACDMRNVPIEIPAVTAALMVRRIAAFLRHGPITTTMDVVDMERGSWFTIAPPDDHDELIADLHDR